MAQLLSQQGTPAPSLPPRIAQAEVTPETDPEYATFKKEILRLCGIDLNAYKDAQMHRRILSLASRHGTATFATYVALLKQDAQRLHEFRDFITINVTEFFRNPASYVHLRDRVLPDLLKHSPNLTIWSAGCSIGAEPYSIAMLLMELAPRGTHKILATDIDTRIVQRAQGGSAYMDSELKAMDSTLRQKYMQPNPAGGFDVVPALKKWIAFKPHNLLADPFPTRCDLIICRNVVIYFKEEAKDHLYGQFGAALRPGGMLFVGGTEILRTPHAWGLAPAGTSFYRKAE